MLDEFDDLRVSSGLMLMQRFKGSDGFSMGRNIIDFVGIFLNVLILQFSRYFLQLRVYGSGNVDICRERRLDQRH